jgi:hypothetical protein
MRLEMVSSMRSAPASRSVIDCTRAVLIAVLSEASRSAVMSARAVMASGRVPSRWSTMSVMALRAELTPVSMMSAALRALSPTVEAALSMRAVTPLSASAMRRMALSMPRPRLSLTSATLLAISVDTALAALAHHVGDAAQALVDLVARRRALRVDGAGELGGPVADGGGDAGTVWLPSVSASCWVRVLSASD